jgi:non-ribosomal peptide synthetase component E (peptide arylation enzyme)
MAKPVRYTPEIIAEYTKQGYWEPVTYGDLWDRNARDFPDKEAIVDSKRRLTWAQGKLWIDRLALKFLELDIKRDDVVVVQLPVWAESYLVPVACEKAGIVSMPVLRAFRHSEIEHLLRYVEAVGLVVPWKFRDFDYFGMIQEIRPNLPKLKHVFVAGDEVPEGAISISEIIEEPIEKKYPIDYLKRTRFTSTDVGLIRYTTGTTGFPKLPIPLICNFIYSGKAAVEIYGLRTDDIGIVLSPAVAGPNHLNFLSAPLVGCKVIMQERFEAGQALRLIEREKVTFVPAVPAMLSMLLEHPDFDKCDLSSVRFVVSAGAPLPYKLGKLAEEKFGCPLAQHYGSAECGLISSTSPDEPQEVRLLTVGKPVSGVEVKLVYETGKEVAMGEVGEIWGRGPTFTDSFYKDRKGTEQAWTKDGWFKTSDLAKFDDNGNIVLVGRSKDVIIRGGQNIYPAEVEDILLTHPYVLDASVVGMPDPSMGERACAYVVPRQGQQFTFDEMLTFLKSKRIAPYKSPERLELIDKLPMVAEGQKVDKKLLVQDITRKLEREGKLKKTARLEVHSLMCQALSFSGYFTAGGSLPHVS